MIINLSDGVIEIYDISIGKFDLICSMIIQYTSQNIKLVMNE